MTKEAKIVIAAALVFLSFFAYGKWQNEYARIQSRVEVTQAKVDALADELKATTATIHAAIKSLTDRFLAGEIEVDEDEQLSDSGLFGAARSSKWSEVRKDFLKLHPTCEACGIDVDLNCHHIKPFNQFPELELEPSNLITLCRKHHFEVGHLGNWRTANATVRDDAAKIRIGLSRQVTIPTIIMHSSPTCGPCNKWKNNELDRWTKAGWQVEVKDEEHCERAKWPWYEITDRDGSQFEVIGPLNNDNFNAAKLGK
tara:strand:- start:1605 stop:2372 length:768 start_codon:yes stop_codon:yes gene_type:complete